MISPRALNLYLVERKDVTHYDQYDSAVVAASTAHDAKELTVKEWHTERWSTWTTIENLKAERIGTATERTRPSIILGSFNAG